MDPEQNSAIGWISIAELFLLVGALLLASVVLYHSRLEEERTQNSGLMDVERQLRRDLEQLHEEAESLRIRLHEQEQRLVALSRAEEKARGLLKQVVEQNGQLARLKDELDLLRTQLAEIKEERSRLEQEKAELQAKLKRLREQLEAAQTLGSKTDKEVEVLKAKVKTFENRFEGLRLDGKKVVFLLDRSGSMGSVDQNTPAPAKWQTVCDTVGRIMRSLPDLEQFQLIMFSDKVSFPLGKEGEWIDFEGEKTVDGVVSRIKAAPPEGGTNLYSGFETAFRYRQLGLEAIYLFSDGLPNLGPGLTDRDMVLIDEVGGRDTKRAENIKSEVLGRYLRSVVREQWNQGKVIRIESVGFFYESPDLGAFLWGLSRENGGSFVGMSRP
jgi:hypothetical protein